MGGKRPVISRNGCSPLSPICSVTGNPSSKLPSPILKTTNFVIAIAPYPPETRLQMTR